jgi:hypothetical protein
MNSQIKAIIMFNIPILLLILMIEFNTKGGKKYG